MTDEDFKPEASQESLSDDELDAVSGGSKCGCFGSGGGTKGTGYRACGCYMGGAGNFDDGVRRCYCFMPGGGVVE